MDPVVTTTAGRVRGRTEEGAAVFLGVPFAAPPFGVNRLQPPAPPVPWSDIRDAHEYGPTAPQPHRQFTLIPEPVMDGDDCLNLNVFTPDPAGRLPVLFWIHGGGFTAGCNASQWYRGLRFARDGVVVVSVNYRLGAEGFLAIDGAPANRGVLDWIAALGWVQGNIASFGGDPDRVTIAGQSAGGVACATLLTSPAARGLFRSAICMSGARLGTITMKRATTLATAMATELGIANSIEGFAAVPPARLIEAQETVVAAQARQSDAVRLALGPITDDTLVVDSCDDADVSKALMLGATAEEFNAAVMAMTVDDARLERRLGRMGLGDDGIAAYRNAYPDAAPAVILGQAVTDSAFKAPAVHLADRWTTRGGRAFMYDFEWRSGAGLGSVHCLDVPFAFDNLDADGVEQVTGKGPPQDLADAVHGAWVRFITDGDPGWEAYEPNTRRAMVFDEVSKVVDDPWRLPRTVWPAS